MNYLVSIEKERKKNLPIGQTTVLPSFGPVFAKARHRMMPKTRRLMCLGPFYRCCVTIHCCSLVVCPVTHVVPESAV